MKYCPLCSKPHYDKPDNMWKLYISTSSGAYNCFRCGSTGSLFDLKERVSGIVVLQRLRSPAHAASVCWHPSQLGDLGKDVTTSISAQIHAPPAPQAVPRVELAVCCSALCTGQHVH